MNDPTGNEQVIEHGSAATPPPTPGSRRLPPPRPPRPSAAAGTPPTGPPRSRSPSRACTPSAMMKSATFATVPASPPTPRARDVLLRPEHALGSHARVIEIREVASFVRLRHAEHARHQLQHVHALPALEIRHQQLPRAPLAVHLHRLSRRSDRTDRMDALRVLPRRRYPGANDSTTDFAPRAAGLPCSIAVARASASVRVLRRRARALGASSAPWRRFSRAAATSPTRSRQLGGRLRRRSKRSERELQLAARRPSPKRALRICSAS